MHAIATDRKSGALELALGVVRAFEALCRSRQIPSEIEVRSAAKFLSKAHPSIVPIHNVAEMCALIVTGGGDPVERLQRLRYFLEKSRERVAVNSQGILPPHGSMITISRSSTVLKALSLAGSSRRIGTVYVSESRPRLEGVMTARALTEQGIECVLMADAEGPSLVKDVDLAVVGGDAILNDGGVVNKIGTYPLALACREAGKPLFVLAESIKLERRYDMSTWPGPEERDERELLPKPPKGLRALNRYFDLTPPSLVAAVVHEGGVSKRSWVKAMDKVLRDGMDSRA